MNLPVKCKGVISCDYFCCRRSDIVQVQVCAGIKQKRKLHDDKEIQKPVNDGKQNDMK